MDKMEEQNKLQFFREAKIEYTISNYLTTIPTRELRTLSAKLRLGVLKLEVENGRKIGLDRAERGCKLCNSGEVEDEAHFLFSCESLQQTRQTYLNPIISIQQELSNVSHLDKLMYLYFNENLGTEELTLAMSLLLNLKTARDHLLRSS